MAGKGVCVCGGGGGGGGGDPLFECYFTKVTPLTTFDDFRDSAPHVFIFQANLRSPPSESFQSFRWSPFLGSQLRLIPPFVVLKIKWFPPQILPSPYLSGDK